MKNIHMTDEQFKTMINGIKNNESVSMLAAVLNQKPQTIATYKSIFKKNPQERKAWFNNRLKRVFAEQYIPTQDEIDRYGRLKQAYQVFEQGLFAFIDEEMAAQHHDLQTENKRLQEAVLKLQKENTEYKTVVQAARESNWVDGLKKKWTQA